MSICLDVVNLFQIASATQGDRLSGKPENVWEFNSCQGNVSDFTENQGIVREKILRGKTCLKLYCKLHIFVRTGIS